MGLSQDKGKGKERAEMEECKPEKAHSQSLTVSEYAGAFHGGEDSCFVYSWIDNKHGDSFSNQRHKGDRVVDRQELSLGTIDHLPDGQMLSFC